MADVTLLQRLCLVIDGLRVPNADSRMFIPGKALETTITRANIAAVVAHLSSVKPPYVQEVIDFIVCHARNVFGMLAYIGHPAHITDFMAHDQLQERHTDDRLPFSREDLALIIKDVVIANRFFDVQWEICAPVFHTRMMPRALEPQTVLPYRTDRLVSAGAFGQVYQVRFHAGHQPAGYDSDALFARKEFQSHDTTYENEILVLATLQGLQHPNLLRLLACYTHHGRHNIISPFIHGGTLSDFVRDDGRILQNHGDMFYLISGLASAVWALHELASTHGTPLKGHHQDLRGDNVLFDGKRFILADFGLSSIKTAKDDSNTPFKGRKGYCQAPECADLVHPFQEHTTNRATDIFQLGCLIVDLMIYFIQGAAAVKEFTKRRQYDLPPMRYRLYHRGTTANDVVEQLLQDLCAQDLHRSTAAVVGLVRRMLEILPEHRPSAEDVVSTLSVATISAYTQQIEALFDKFGSSDDAILERARFRSWYEPVDMGNTLHNLSPVVAAEKFDDIVASLKRLIAVLEFIKIDDTALDCRHFLESRRITTELLDRLPSEQRSSAHGRLESVLLSMVGSDNSSPMFQAVQRAFGQSRMTEMAEAKHMLVRTASQSTQTKELDRIPHMVHGSLSKIRDVGTCTLVKTRGHGGAESQTLLAEYILCHEQLRKDRLRPRVFALCDLLCNASPQFRTLSFHGLHDSAQTTWFALLYSLSNDIKLSAQSSGAQSLHDILTERDQAHFPPVEDRMQLSLQLAEAIANFHTVDWYHKDLTSRSILFFNPTDVSSRITEPHLFGFQHSRTATDDFSEGPSQHTSHHRYHHPSYIQLNQQHFEGFRPKHDYYSLGIVLLEIGLWSAVDAVMADSKHLNNKQYLELIISDQIPKLRFSMGSLYATVTRFCLTGFDGSDTGRTPNDVQSKLMFREQVIKPLKTVHQALQIQCLPSSHVQRHVLHDREDEPGAKRVKMAP